MARVKPAVIEPAGGSTDTETKTHVQRTYPKDTLEDSLVIATAIQEKNAGKPMKRIFVADAIGRKPESSAFHTLLSSSIKYGLTEGGEKAEFIKLTTLGQSITRPKSPEEKPKGLQDAALSPDLFRRIYEHYRDAKIPTGEFFKNVLEGDYGVDRSLVDDCLDVLMANGRFTKLIQDVAGAPRVVFGEYPETGETGEKGVIQTGEEAEVKPSEVPPTVPKPEVGQIFVAHGKNRTPLEQLKKILDQFQGVRYKVAIDEPLKGRPISIKVAELMRNCSSAIFIFTGDEEYQDPQGNKTMKPSDNVVYELGAASVLYGNKIVIFREEGVVFASDFKDIGYIPFQKDNLDAKAMDLMKELIAFGLLKVTAA